MEDEGGGSLRTRGAGVGRTVVDDDGRQFEEKDGNLRTKVTERTEVEDDGRQNGWQPRVMGVS